MALFQNLAFTYPSHKLCVQILECGLLNSSFYFVQLSSKLFFKFSPFIYSKKTLNFFFFFLKKQLSVSSSDLCSVCGQLQVQPRIFDGTPSKYGPWSVYLDYDYNDSTYICTGTIIDFQVSCALF